MTVEELRSLVLSHDGAVESVHQSGPDFRYRNRIVVNLDEAGQSITIKLSLSEQAALMSSGDPGFSLPGAWAKHGWTRIGLNEVDNAHIAELVDMAWSEAMAR